MINTFRRLSEYVVVYLFGGLIYALLEVLLRGSTHWTMLLTGGLCFLLLYLISVYSREPLWRKALMGAFVITTIEFLVGIMVNLILGWNVWDYSAHRFNLLGQICLLFSMLWFFVSIAGVHLSGLLHKMFRERQ